jgi:transcription elongation factor GreA
VSTDAGQAQAPGEPTPKKPKKPDRWAHRRAEPRTLAFVWAIYILTAGLLTIGVLLIRGPWALLDKDVYQYAARTMLLCVALGLAILWPMARLSQSVPLRERASGAIFKDMLVLLPPTQAVVWAQAAARAGWAIDLIAAIALSLVAWPMLAGAVMALVLRPRATHSGGNVYDEGTPFVGAPGPSGLARTTTMAGFVAAALLPLLALRVGPGWASMLSPVSAMLDLAHARDVGPGSSSVDHGRWTVLLAQAGLAALAWLLLAVFDRRPKNDQTPEGPESGPDAATLIASPTTPRGQGPVPGIRGDRLSGTPSVPDARRLQEARTQEGRPMDYMTAEEQAKIKARLNELIANRPKITERIAEARALGDLKENAEYHSARELQGMEEAEIRRLEDRLEHAKVVNDDLAKDAQVAFLGSMVKIREVSDSGPTGKPEMVKLVGDFSEDPPDDYDEVTVNSPMGSALMKSRVGEVVRVDAPRGVKRFEILEIS